MKKLALLVVCFAVFGCSEDAVYSVPTGYFISTKGCNEGAVEVIRIAMEGDLYKARRQHYKCDTEHKSYKLDFGEFKGALPVGYTPPAVPKEGVEISAFAPPKHEGDRFSLFAVGEPTFVFEDGGQIIRSFPTARDREELEYIKGRNDIPEDVRKAIKAANAPDGLVAYRKFANEKDPIQTERTDLHKWFITAQAELNNQQNTVSSAERYFIKNTNDDLAIQERLRFIFDNISDDAVNENLDSLKRVFGMAIAGAPSSDLLIAARKEVRGNSFEKAMAGWNVLKKEARNINDYNIANFGKDIHSAVKTQSFALAMNPFDREISGNLAYFLLLSKNYIEARKIIIYTMALSRPENSTLRGFDLQMLSAVAERGDLDIRVASLKLAVAVSKNISGFCKSIARLDSDTEGSVKDAANIVIGSINETHPELANDCVLIN